MTNPNQIPDPSPDDEKVFIELTQDIPVSDSNLIDDDGDIPEKRYLALRCDELPKISVLDILGNWLELRTENAKFSLHGIGLMKAGVLCEVENPDLGSMQYMVVQGSIAAYDEGPISSVVLSKATQVFSTPGSLDSKSRGSKLFYDVDTLERLAVLYYDQFSVMRDAVIQMRQAFLPGDIDTMMRSEEKNIFKTLQAEVVEMPSGSEEVFLVDLSAVYFEYTYRARLYDETHENMIESFGRADAPSWEQNN